MITSGRTVCPFCPDVELDLLGHHAVTWRHGEQHNHLRDVVVDTCWQAHLSVAWRRAMVLPEITITPDLHLDVIAEWDRGNPAAFDVPSYLEGIMLNCWYIAETRKHLCNECQELEWSCIPLAAETFGNSLT